MNKSNQIPGFTLIELIVVISIISLLLLFSFPMFEGIELFSDNTGSAGNIARLSESLKKRAVENNKDFLLHIDKTQNRVWVTSDDMDDEKRAAAKQKGVHISSDTQIVSIQFAGLEKEGALEFHIRFRKQGYSDFVLIHMVENGRDLTLRIDPFLSHTQVLDGHIDFEECI